MTTVNRRKHKFVKPHATLEDSGAFLAELYAKGYCPVMHIWAETIETHGNTNNYLFVRCIYVGKRNATSQKIRDVCMSLSKSPALTVSFTTGYLTHIRKGDVHEQ